MCRGSTVLRSPNSDTALCVVQGPVTNEVGVYVHKSCFLFPVNSFVRSTAFKVIHSAGFEVFIILSICISSAMMALESPWRPDPAIEHISVIVDPIFLSIFTVEMVLKITALGFYGANLFRA